MDDQDEHDVIEDLALLIALDNDEQGEAPLNQPQRYVNRHHNYSILVQCVCDHKLLYRDVFIGQPGSVGDARMFNRSPLSDSLLMRPDLISNDEHLLGDGAYTLTRNMEVTSPLGKGDTITLSSARVSVERSFALLKNEFRRLKSMQSYRLEIALDHIMASVMLHNFVLLEGNESNGLCGNGHYIRVHGGPPDAEILQAARHEGALKREYIAALLSPEE